MNDAELRRLVRRASLTEEGEAGLRSWEVVRAAFEEREPAPRRRHHARALALAAAALALVAATLSPPGRALVGSIRAAVAPNAPTRIRAAAPALFSLPTRGRILVNSSRGPGVVQANGSRRRLGPYGEATWSPRGLYVAATRGRTLLALEPDGDVRWSLARPSPVRRPRWSPSGYRIAYLSGGLRVVAGNGEDDRRLDGPAEAFAWRPGERHVLAYGDRDGRVRVVDADSGEWLWRSPSDGRPASSLRGIEWSADGRRLLVGEQTVPARLDGRRFRLPPQRLVLYDGRGRLVRTLHLGRDREVGSATFARRGYGFAYTDYEPLSNTGRVVLIDGDTGAERILFRGRGRLEDATWSPDGRWLLAGWPDANQWLFLRAPGVGRIAAVSGIAGSFDPAAGGGALFPQIAGWCCP